MSCGAACSVCSRLRAAALEVVKEEGIQRTMLSQIAARASIDEAHAREHYPTASACIAATYEMVALCIYDGFAAAFAAERRWRDAVTLGARHLLARMADHPAEAQMCFVEAPRGDHDLLHRRAQSRQRLVALFTRELMERHEDESERTAEMQLELLIGASFQQIASTVESGHVEELPELEGELRSRAVVFEAAVD